MEMMPTASLMDQDAFKRAPVSSASLSAATNNMLTPLQPPKVYNSDVTSLVNKNCSCQVLSKKRLHDLVEEVDPTQLIDEDVEEVSVYRMVI